MRRNGLPRLHRAPPCILTVFLGVAVPHAATILQRDVTLVIDASAFERTESLVVSLEEAGDLDDWAHYPIYLDDDVRLTESRAEVLTPGGKVVRRVKRRDYQRLDSLGDDLHSSDQALLIPFPALERGDVLRLSVTTRHTPLFPAARIRILLDDRQEKLRVTVQGTGLRWRGQNLPEGVGVRVTPGGLELLGESLEALPPGPGALLQLAWGPATAWSDVARWYAGLTSRPKRQDESLSALARRLTREADTPRGKIEALSRYVKRQVRYVSVQIGDGGWIPTPGPDVLQRGWGDCKDKAELLLGLLETQGISGHLALLRAGWGPPVDVEFPSPFQFNHAIVALPRAALDLREDDPATDDVLFIDPTADRGGIAWLAPSSQGRHALITSPEGGRLVRTPRSSGQEQTGLTFKGRLDHAGGFLGTVRVSFSGLAAMPWLRDLDRHSREENQDALRRMLLGSLPHARVGTARWTQTDDDVPRVVAEASLTLARVLQGDPRRSWMRLGGLPGFPDPGFLEERAGPLPVVAGRWTTEWRLQIPVEGCFPEAADVSHANDLGSFESSLVHGQDGSWILRRESVMHEAWVPTQQLDALRDLATAERRASRRRVGLRCNDGDTPGGLARGAESSRP